MVLNGRSALINLVELKQYTVSLRSIIIIVKKLNIIKIDRFIFTILMNNLIGR